MSITLTFTTSDGKEEQVEYKNDAKIIVLNDKRMDSCTKLSFLYLDDNQLQIKGSNWDV